MTQRIGLPDGTIGEFPDGMPDAEIQAVLRKQFGGPPAVQQPKAPAKQQGFFDLPLAITDPTPENIAADPLMRFAVGAGKNVVGLGQLLSRYLPGGRPDLFNNLANKVQETEGLARSGMEARDEDPMNITGGLGEVLNPIGLKVTKALPAAKGAWNGIKNATGFGASYAVTQPVYGKEQEDFESAKAGQVALGGAAGAAFGGSLALAKFIGKPVIEAVHALFPSAAKAMARDFANTIVGKDNMAKILARLEQEAAKQPSVQGYKPTTGELLAGMPEASPLLALQQATAKTVGGSSAVMESHRMAQDKALRDALGKIAGTPDELAALIKQAKDRAKETYGPVMTRKFSLDSDIDLLGREIAKARGVPRADTPPSGLLPGGNVPHTGRAGALQQAGIMDTLAAQLTHKAHTWTPVPGMPRFPGRYSPHIEQVPGNVAGARTARDQLSLHDNTRSFLESSMTNLRSKGALAEESAAPLMQRPSMNNALEYARKLASERGYGFPKDGSGKFSGQNLHDIKLGLDAQIKAGANKNSPNALDNNTLDAIVGTKSQFIKWFEQKAPEYGKARIEFSKDMSRPNQMVVGQALEAKLMNPQGQMTPGAFLRTIDDETKALKSITGQPRQEFSNIFTPRQTEVIGGVGDTLERRLASDLQGKNVLLGGKNIAEEGTGLFPQLLSRPIAITNWLMKLATNKKSSLEHRIDDINAAYFTNPKAFMEGMRELPPSAASRVYKAMRESGVTFKNQGLLAPTLSAAQE